MTYGISPMGRVGSDRSSVNIWVRLPDRLLGLHRSQGTQLLAQTELCNIARSSSARMSERRRQAQSKCIRGDPSRTIDISGRTRSRVRCPLNRVRSKHNPSTPADSQSFRHSRGEDEGANNWISPIDTAPTCQFQKRLTEPSPKNKEGFLIEIITCA